MKTLELEYDEGQKRSKRRRLTGVSMPKGATKVDADIKLQERYAAGQLLNVLPFARPQQHNRATVLSYVHPPIICVHSSSYAGASLPSSILPTAQNKCNECNNTRKFTCKFGKCASCCKRTTDFCPAHPQRPGETSLDPNSGGHC